MLRLISHFLLATALFLGSLSASPPVQAAARQDTSNLPKVKYSLLDISPISGFWATNHDVIINGRIFNTAGILGVGWFFDGKPSRPTILFKNEGQYDVFEAWIGFRDFSGDGKIQFEVKGDGKTLFQSDFMSSRDPAVHISVPVKDYSGIQLSAVCTREVRFTNSAIWADPIFLKEGSAPTDVSGLTPITSLAPAPSFASLEDKMTVARGADGEYTIQINGQPVNFGYVKPQISGGRVLVPMRKIFEALGAKVVNFDTKTGVIIVTRKDREIQLTLGSNQATINGRLTPLDVPAQSKFGTAMVPLRFVLDAFDVKVDYQ